MCSTSSGLLPGVILGQSARPFPFIRRRQAEAAIAADFHRADALAVHSPEAAVAASAARFLEQIRLPRRTEHNVNSCRESEAFVRILQGYRYFLGIRPGPRWFPFFQRIGAAIGHPIRLDRLHLTLCVIAHVAERDPFVLPRVQTALGGRRLHSFPVNLSRVVAGPHGASARTFGKQDEIQDFYRQLAHLLRACGIEPLHRKSGLHPHVTLGYASLRPTLLKIAIRWFPAELLLIESEVGLTRHNVLGTWPLLPVRQPSLPFGENLIAAADPARRSAA